MIFFFNFFNHFPSKLHPCICVGLCSAFIYSNIFSGLETLRYVLVFSWNSPKQGNKRCKSELSWNHECFEKLAFYWSAEWLPIFVIFITFHRVSIRVDGESDCSYFLNRVILQLLLKVSQHFITSLPCQTSAFKHGIVIHFKGEMLFSSLLTLKKFGEAILLFVSNISLGLIIVLLVNLAAHCLLTSWCQLALPSLPLFSPENEKNGNFTAFCYG